MTPFEVTVLSVTLNAAGIVPSANNRFPLPNVIGNILSQNASPARTTQHALFLHYGNLNLAHNASSL
jgi:hypothetical protein